MKYFVHNNVVMDYDELDKNEIYIYQTPDNFSFDVDLVKKFLEYKNIEYKIDEKLPWLVLVPDENGYNTSYDIGWLIERDTLCKRDNIKKGEFVEWLKTLGVKEVKYEYVG